MLLTREDLSRLLSPEEYLEIVETAFVAHAFGKTLAPSLMHVDADGGEFHIKAGGLQLDRPYFALKANGGFFGNARFDMPPIQGVILLCDAESGYPLALMDSTAITLARTGATTAVAARHLARPDAHTIAICGCGNQGQVQLRYALKTCKQIERAYAWDIDQERAERFAKCMSAELGIDVVACPTVDAALANADICITCTPSRKPFLEARHLRPGMFVAAVGADSPEKQELYPEVLAKAKVVVDLVEQCAAVGELHHGLEAGVLSVSDVYAELSEILTGRKPGRTAPEETFVFDATGTALQDTAAAAAAFVKATARSEGMIFDFFSRKEQCR